MRISFVDPSDLLQSIWKPVHYVLKVLHFLSHRWSWQQVYEFGSVFCSNWFRASLILTKSKLSITNLPVCAWALSSIKPNLSPMNGANDISCGSSTFVTYLWEHLHSIENDQHCTGFVRNATLHHCQLQHIYQNLHRSVYTRADVQLEKRFLISEGIELLSIFPIYKFLNKYKSRFSVSYITRTDQYALKLTFLLFSG